MSERIVYGEALCGACAAAGEKVLAIALGLGGRPVCLKHSPPGAWSIVGRSPEMNAVNASSLAERWRVL